MKKRLWKQSTNSFFQQHAGSDQTTYLLCNLQRSTTFGRRHLGARTFGREDIWARDIWARNAF